MKKGLLIGAFALSSMAALAQDVVVPRVVGGSTDNTWVVNVELQNQTKFVAFSMDVDLPNSTSVVTSKSRTTSRLVNGKSVSIKNESNVSTSYSANYKVEYNQVGNTLHVVGYSLGNEPITGNSGDVLFQIGLSSTSEIASTSFSGSVKNIKFVKQSDLTAQGLTDAALKAFLRGDIDLNGRLNVRDTQEASQMASNKKPKTVYADVNNDGNVRVNDVQRVALIVAKKSK